MEKDYTVENLITLGTAYAQEAAVEFLTTPKYIAGGILFTASKNTADALKNIIQNSTYFFGNHKGTSDGVAQIFDTPLLSPIGGLIKNDSISSFLNIEDESFVSALAKLPVEVMEDAKKVVTDSDFLSNIITPTSPLGTILKLDPLGSEKSLDIFLNNQKESILSNVTQEIEASGVGKFISNGKELINSEKTLENLAGKWINVDSFQDISSNISETNTAINGILTQLGNMTEGLSSSIMGVLNKMDNLDKQLDTITEEAFTTIDTGLEGLKAGISGLEFTMLLIPPMEGGIPQLKVVLANYLDPTTNGAPQLNNDVALFPVVILFTAPIQEIMDVQFNIFTSLFEV